MSRCRRTSRPLAISILCLVLAGCVTAPRITERAPANNAEVARVSVAVVSVAPFEVFASALQPDFKITTTEALAQASATTSTIEDQFSRSVQALVKLAPGTLTEERVQTSGDTLSSSTTRKASPGDLSKVTGPSIVDTAQAPSFAASAAPVSAVNAMLRYHLATALYQEVQLLNRYVKAAPRMTGYVPFVARLQVNVRQLGTNTPYNADVDIEFSDQQLGQDACSAHSPRVVPLLVNDNLDIASAATTRQNVVTLGLALSALRGNVGLGLDSSTRTEQLLRALGNEYNSLLNVATAAGRKGSCTLSVHVGALAKDVDKHELVTQSNMVTVLLLVPIPEKQEDAGGMPMLTYESGPTPTRKLMLRAVSTFSHARTGVLLSGAPPAPSDGEFEVTFWRRPRLPPQDQFVELLLLGDKAPYKGTVALRGGDGLTRPLIDRACLAPKAAESCGKGSLFADDVEIDDDRNGLSVQFGQRLDGTDQPSANDDGGALVKVGGMTFERVCVEVDRRDRSARDYGLGNAKPLCAKLSHIRFDSPPKLREPMTDTKVTVHEGQLVAGPDGSGAVVVTVKFPAAKPATDNPRPQRVELSVDGAAVLAATPQGASTTCAALLDAVRVSDDCSVLIRLGNLSPRSAVRISAKAYQPLTGKPDKEVDLDVAGSRPEVLLDFARPCRDHGCCQTAVICPKPSAPATTAAANAGTRGGNGSGAKAVSQRSASGAEDGIGSAASAALGAH